MKFLKKYFDFSPGEDILFCKEPSFQKFMNTQLEKLFTLYDVSPKDRYDFLQIYQLLPDFKKVRVIERFEDMLSQIQLLRSELQSQQQILLGETLESIESRLDMIRREKILSGSKSDIEILRKSF